ncbi:DNA-directed RNA polymerase subunit [Thecamonas trahens ATCC 50062]|uniref:DNA-directed RNA polymerase subunit n=1 Tax=Thecamonas trahens ATCC 50062 TaxID=461836 RepID=A0A0L0D811_THETB|nr:DNA-directed RNA polymerase subunit [Thecamonas trahens ATCC 50062]KNC48206.1 DNA-directed RNA polymerase subunit [Thecamonas trahens ATCC 50062]|eukprot:XP_013758775.1 DNA-directed RNA polymerase subunit [Thecamonas trahens ATCC 50062]
MEFCVECNNLLHPKCSQDNDGQFVLNLECMTCDFVGPASSMKVFTRKVVRRAEDTASQITDEVISDPTLPRSFQTKCASCGGEEAVFFQSHIKTGDTMTLFFVCCNEECKNRWTM